MLINVIMPTIVGILTFVSRINYVLSRVDHEKCLITPGHGLRGAREKLQQKVTVV